MTLGSDASSWFLSDLKAAKVRTRVAASMAATAIRSVQWVRLQLLHFFFFFFAGSSAVDFLFNSFPNSSNGSDIILISDAYLDASVIRLSNDSNQFSYGRAFYQTKLRMRPDSNSSSIGSFSTSFIFSIVPQIASSPGFGLAFVLSNTTSPPGALSSQYFGLFDDAKTPSVAPLLAVEFDVGQNPEFNDPDSNHIGINLNRVESEKTQTAGYYDYAGNFVPLQMRTGQNIHSWIDFDGVNFEINVTVAPVGIARPSRPTLTFQDPIIANYVSAQMYVGFSASKTNWIEARRILAWSLSDSGNAREINRTAFPIFTLESKSSLSSGAVAGIVIGATMFFIVFAIACYWFWRKKRLREEKDEEVEEWEMEYWPHRFSFNELSQATKNFADDHILGFGGFGKVYKGTLPTNSIIAVKCINHDSKQGVKEFMAEISSMGRLQHKNLVQMRGWCRKGNQLMLVYDFMPNGSLNRWIFDKPTNVLGWLRRRRVLNDVAEGLNYLHRGWDQIVIHRDIKSSNILLDSEMRGRLGDFGLAKLYQHGGVPNTTRIVGTLGYLAPEVATTATPTEASDVFSFGVVILEVVCGRRPIDMAAKEEEVVLVDWVRDLYARGRASEAVDPRIEEEYEAAEMDIILKLGLSCCHPDPQRRPTMNDVVAVLSRERTAATRAVVLSASASGNGIAPGDGANTGTFKDE